MDSKLEKDAVDLARKRAAGGGEQIRLQKFLGGQCTSPKEYEECIRVVNEYIGLNGLAEY